VTGESLPATTSPLLSETAEEPTPGMRGAWPIEESWSPSTPHEQLSPGVQPTSAGCRPSQGLAQTESIVVERDTIGSLTIEASSPLPNGLPPDTPPESNGSRASQRGSPSLHADGTTICRTSSNECGVISMPNLKSDARVNDVICEDSSFIQMDNVIGAKIVENRRMTKLSWINAPDVTLSVIQSLGIQRDDIKESEPPNDTPVVEAVEAPSLTSLAPRETRSDEDTIHNSRDADNSCATGANSAAFWTRKCTAMRSGEQTSIGSSYKQSCQFINTSVINTPPSTITLMVNAASDTSQKVIRQCDVVIATRPAAPQLRLLGSTTWTNDSHTNHRLRRDAPTNSRPIHEYMAYRRQGRDAERCAPTRSPDPTALSALLLPLKPDMKANVQCIPRWTLSKTFTGLSRWLSL
jgi:hypothetical protein